MGDRYYTVKFEDNKISRKVQVNRWQSRPSKNQVIVEKDSGSNNDQIIAERDGSESSRPGDSEIE